MEASPLTLAHRHARHGTSEASKANAVAASEEFDLAAGEFANAAKSTSDLEALRTLKLLEEHHLKLAELLKSKPDAIPSTNPQSSVAPAATATASTPASTPAAEAASPTASSPSKTAIASSASKKVTTAHSSSSSVTKILESSPRHISQHVSPPSLTLRRDNSSSIASNLATARGIPPSRQRRTPSSNTQVSTQTAEGRLLNPHRRSRVSERQQTPSSPSTDEKASPLLSEKALLSSPHAARSDASARLRAEHGSSSATENVAEADDRFSRFYNTFGNLISTLSAPLAFAGLPLNLPDSPTASIAAAPSPTGPSGTPDSPTTHTLRAAADPDLTRFFSRAALRAVRDGNGAFGGAESFYVVPSTGGTMSYAGMLSNPRQPSTLTEDDEAEFVDARESPSVYQTSHLASSASAGLSRRAQGAAISTGRSGTTRNSSGRGASTWEELAVENESLKAVVLDLGDRLRAFELGAQKSSLALHASIRALSSPTASTAALAAVSGGGGGKSNDANAGRGGDGRSSDGTSTTKGRSGSVPPMPDPSSGPTLKLLEEKLNTSDETVRSLQRENKKLSRENQKLLSVVERYRERWETLKEGARGRARADGVTRPAAI